MKILAILAHHNKTSFSARTFYAVVDHLRQQGANVDVLDLYDRYKEIPFYFSQRLHTDEPNLPLLTDFPFFQENKERLIAADRIFIVHPIYWSSVPGILKCWIDLITNFAWKYEGKKGAKPLHKITKAFVVNSSHVALWRRRYLDFNPARRQLEQLFDFIGIKDYDFYEIGNTGLLNQTKETNHIEKIIVQSGSFLLK